MAEGRITISLVILLSLICLARSSPGQARSASLVTHAVDTLQVRTLGNHHPLWASPANDLGAVAADEQMGTMTLVLGRTAERQKAFAQLLADQQNPASPEYHHWLTPEEIGQRFGVSDSDLDAVAGWLAAEHLQVTYVSNSRTFLRFTGTAGNVGAAFGTELHRYNVNGRQRLSVATEPTIPEALVSAVKVVRGLYEAGDHPLYSASVEASESPEMTSSSGNHYISPKDFATIYNLGSTYTGTGFTVGIVGEARVYTGDLNNYKSLTQTTFTNPTEVVPTAYGGVDPGAACSTTTCSANYEGAQSEATLDVQRVGSTAPGASIQLVVATDASGGIGVDTEYMVDTSPAPVNVISISWGDCEADANKSDVTFWDTLFSNGAAEGISTFVSSGDSGASGCEAAFTTPDSQSALSPNYICSSSYATCVGGTEFNDTASPSTYWNGTNGAGYLSAYGYIPEGAWNDSTMTKVAGTGGGVSSYVATPSWQTGTGVPGTAGRYTPDVSFSGSQHDGYFGCMAASGGSCVVSSGSFTFLAFAGTSASAPSMAGVAALVDQKLGSAQGNLNPKIYSLANSSSYSSIFHDVTVASSGVVGCAADTPSLCNNTIPSSSSLTGGVPGYTVNSGFDEATGWGSLNIANFLSSFGNTQSTPTVTVTPGASSITVGQTLSVTVTVNGTGATPTGSVVLSGGGYTSASTILTGGSATIHIGAGALTQGTDTLTATYTPDSNSSSAYGVASGTTSIIVTSLYTPAVSLSPTTASITVGQPLSVTVAVSGTNGTPTGSVTLTRGSYTSASTALASGSATINIPAGALALGTYVLTATYAPDGTSSPIYSSATGTSQVTVATRYTPLIGFSPNPATITVAQPLAETVTVIGSDGSPTGAVVLSGAGYTSASTALSNGSATINIPAGTLPVGSNNMTATYTPDASGSQIYIGAAGLTTVYVTQKYTPTVTVTPGAGSISTAQPLTVTVAVSGTDGTATGSVILSGGGYTSASTALVGGSATINIAAGALALGTDTLTANYTPDSNSSQVYNTASGSNSVTVTAKYTPTVTVTPGANSITIAQPLTVTVAVTGAGGTATGSVVLSGGGYTSASTVLVSGGATFNISSGVLSQGTDTLTGSYTPDSNSAPTYSAVTGSNTVIVTPKYSPTVTVTPGASSITTGQPLTVTVAVSGSDGTTTGSVVLFGGGYTSAATSLTSGGATIDIPAGALAQGSDTLTVNYAPDSNSSPVYNSASGSNSVTVTPKLNPTVTVTPGANSITVGQTLAVTVTVAGTGATPTGSVVLTGGGYTSATTTLNGGSTTINIAAGVLAQGSDTLTANYTPDATSSPIYNTASGSKSVTVTPKLTPAVTVTPGSGSVYFGQTVTVTVVVNGTGGTATGNVTLAGGGYTSAAVALVSGSATITIPANSLTTAADTLTATYTPDPGSTPVYLGSTGTGSVTVAASSYSLALGTTSGSVTAGGQATATVTVPTSSYYTGTLTLSCAVSTLISSPSHVPTCSLSSASASMTAGAQSPNPITLTIYTTASSSTCTVDNRNAPHLPWKTGGGMVLACLVLFGLPRHRRRVRGLLMAVLLGTVFASSIVACGSKVESCTTTTVPGTTAGLYTVTLTGTGTPSAQTGTNPSFALTVN
jgi:subtilase family serine protease